MRLVTYRYGADTRAGVVAPDDTVLPLTALDSDLPNDMIALIEAGPETWARLGQAAKRAQGGIPIDSAASPRGVRRRSQLRRSL
jgi:hypothetical protein